MDQLSPLFLVALDFSTNQIIAYSRKNNLNHLDFYSYFGYVHNILADITSNLVELHLLKVGNLIALTVQSIQIPKFEIKIPKSSYDIIVKLTIKMRTVIRMI